MASCFRYLVICLNCSFSCFTELIHIIHISNVVLLNLKYNGHHNTFTYFHNTVLPVQTVTLVGEKTESSVETSIFLT